MDIIEIDGMPCIVIEDDILDDTWYHVIIDYTGKQDEKEMNFLEEVLIELEELWDDMVKHNADESREGKKRE